MKTTWDQTQTEKLLERLGGIFRRILGEELTQLDQEALLEALTWIGEADPRLVRQIHEQLAVLEEWERKLQNEVIEIRGQAWGFVIARQKIDEIAAQRAREALENAVDNIIPFPAARSAMKEAWRRGYERGQAFMNRILGRREQ